MLPVVFHPDPNRGILRSKTTPLSTLVTFARIRKITYQSLQSRGMSANLIEYRHPFFHAFFASSHRNLKHPTLWANSPTTTFSRGKSLILLALTRVVRFPGASGTRATALIQRARRCDPVVFERGVAFGMQHQRHCSDCGRAFRPAIDYTGS
jgi:hypothetical protein